MFHRGPLYMNQGYAIAASYVHTCINIYAACKCQHVCHVCLETDTIDMLWKDDEYTLYNVYKYITT